MSYILSRNLQDGIPSPFLIVCEGYGDASFIDRLLSHHKITTCRVGCPSRDSAGGEGKEALARYLGAVRLALQRQKKELEGVLVVLDADTSQAKAYESARKSLEFGDFSAPVEPFIIEEHIPRTAIYVIPGKGRDGTLEHLFLDAVYLHSPKAKECTDNFFDCVGKLQCNSNQEAKMRLSSLVGATCRDNPWASPSLLWSDNGNPIPIDSPVFDSLVGFIKNFSA